MWRYWRIVDPRKAIILTGLLIAFISGTIHLIMISTDRYDLNTWKTPTAQLGQPAAGAK